MAGNSRRRGATRKPGTKKGPVVGSGGQRKKGLQGKGPTPRAEDRTGHVRSRRAAAGSRTGPNGTAGARKQDQGPASRRSSGGTRSRSGAPEAGETIAGRNTVLEALRADVPVQALYVAEGIDADQRVREVLRIAAENRVPLLQAPRFELDRVTAGAAHQGIALTVPPYEYWDVDGLLASTPPGAAPLLVALDQVTDPRNLGAVVRSAAAFGAQGVVVPERRSAGMSAGAWKTSAGAASRIGVARVTNLARSLREMKKSGIFVVGLAADGEVEISDLAAVTEPLCLVVGSEGSGLSNGVADACDLRAKIPMTTDLESLNAGVAAGVALYDIVRRRRT